MLLHFEATKIMWQSCLPAADKVIGKFDNNSDATLMVSKFEHKISGLGVNSSSYCID